VFAFACVLFLFNFYTKISKLHKIYGKDLKITGVVSEIPYKNDNYYNYVIDAEKVENIENLPKFKISLETAEALEVEAGDGVLVDLFLSDFNNIKNKMYNRSKNIYAKGYFHKYKDFKIIKNYKEKNIFYKILKLKVKLIEILDKYFEKQTSDLISSVWLGQKQKMPHNLRSKFSDARATHLLVFSGLHISVLLQFCDIFLKFLKARKILREFLKILCILFFMCIVGFSPSVVRSGIMYIIFLISRMTFMEYDQINSLGIAILPILISNPLSVWDIGLWLSVFSAFGIILYSNNFSKLLRRKLIFLPRKNTFLNCILEDISHSIVRAVFTFPIIVWYFRKISLFFVIFGIFTMFSSIILLNLTIISIFFKYFFNLNFWINLTNLLAKLTIFLVKSASEIPLVNLNYSYIQVWLSFTLVLISFLFFFKKYKTDKIIRKVIMISLNLLLLGHGSYILCTKNKLFFSFLCDNSQTILISKKNDSFGIVSGINGTKIKNYLFGIGKPNLNYLVNFNKNFININDFLENYNIKNIVDYNNSSRKDIVFNDLNKNIIINIYNFNNKPWISLRVKNLSMLSCPQGGDAVYLPLNLRNFDIFIINYLPNNFYLMNFKYIILLNNDYFVQKNSKKLTNYIVFDGREHDILLEINLRNNKNTFKRKI
jgi:competence protein ComEC